MRNWIISLICLLVAALEPVFADFYRASCEVDQKAVDVVILRKEAVDSIVAKSGVFFYSHNYNRSAYFLILLSGENDPKSEAFAGVAWDGLRQVFGRDDVMIKDLVPIKMPDSSVLLVGNVEKQEFVKIASNERILDLKRRLDPLLGLGNSLIFRGGGFQRDENTTVNAIILIPGDVVIAPVRNVIESGQNFHRMIEE